MLHKFLENDFAKLERLVELHVTYAHKVADIERNQGIVAEASRQASCTCNECAQELKKDGVAEDEIELQQYSERLDAGLFTLQTIDFVIAEVCVGCGEEVWLWCMLILLIASGR